MMKKLFLALLLAGTQAHALDVRVVQGTAPAAATTVDLTSSGFGTPTAAIIESIFVTAMNTDTASAVMSYGFTDCTTEEVEQVNALDAGAANDTHQDHLTTKAVLIMVPGTGTIARSADASCITDGIRLTYAEAGTQYLVKVTLFRDVGSVLSGTVTPNATQNSTVDITTTFTTKLGFFAQTGVTDAGGNTLQFSSGVMHFATPTITQRAAYYRMENGDASPTPDGGLVTNRVTNGDTANGTTPNYGTEVTGVTGTTVTLTTRDGAGTNGGVVNYLLLELPSNSAWVGTSTSPVNASTDWTETGPGFTPIAFGLTLTDYAAVNTIVSGSAEAGTTGFFTATDDGAEFTAATYWQNAALNTGSRMEDTLFLPDHSGTADLDMDDPTFSASGFTFPNANITASDASVHIGWAIAADAATSSLLLRRRRN